MLPVFARHGNDKHGVIDIQESLFFSRVNRRRGSFSASFRFPDLRNGMGTWMTFAARQWTLGGVDSASAAVITGRRTIHVFAGVVEQAAGESPPGRAPARAKCGGQRGRSGTGPTAAAPACAAPAPPPIDVIFILD